MADSDGRMRMADSEGKWVVDHIDPATLPKYWAIFIHAHSEVDPLTAGRWVNFIKTLAEE